MATRIRQVDPDPELLADLAASEDAADRALAELLTAAGLDATVWRVRLCDDCGAAGYSAEVYVDGRQARRRLGQLRAWRAGAHVPGWRAESAMRGDALAS